MTAIALTIAGSDSGGGAGIQADLKTFSALKVYGASVITAITAQNTRGVTAIHDVPASIITAQLDAVLDDLAVNAVKIGMLSTVATIEAVSDALRRRNLAPVLDPVMIATSGDRLLSTGAVSALTTQLLPLARIITPNLPEAASLLGTAQATSVDEMCAQARAIADLGCRAVLIKGGHGTQARSIDILFDGAQIHTLDYPRINTRNTHGTGCTLAAAIAAHLARDFTLEDAVRAARAYLQISLEHADTLHIGAGHGPVHHFSQWWSQ